MWYTTKESRNMRFFHRHKKRLRKKDHCMYRKFGKRILGIILSGCGNEMQVEARKLIDQMQKYVDEKLEELNECKRDI